LNNLSYLNELRAHACRAMHIVLKKCIVIDTSLCNDITS